MAALNRDEVFYETSPIVAVPRQEIRLAPQNSIFNTMIHVAQQNQQIPATPNTVLNIQQKPNLSSGSIDFFVQFMRDPTDKTYTGTTVFLANPTGTSELAALGVEGPIKFSRAANSVPDAISAQTNTVTSRTSTNFGEGNSRTINLL